MVKRKGKKTKTECHFCKRYENEPLEYGPIYKKMNISVHYHCLLMATNLPQNGDDHEGIMGFLMKDIKLFLKIILKNKCAYCGKKNASIRCSQNRCRKMFHLPCGIQAGALNQYFDKFKSFCSIHRPVQKIPRNILKEAKSNKVSCYVCLEELDIKDKKNSLWAPCCRTTWYHKYCLQRMAYNAGYFFKCSICSNTKKFLRWTQKFGIYVPQQDAAWELEPHAYEDLLFKYDKCDASMCFCPKGRNVNIENSKWEVLSCNSCGAQGVHVFCCNLKNVENWECQNCLNVTARISLTNTSSESSSQAITSASSNEILISRKRKRESEKEQNAFLEKRKNEKFNIVSLESEELTISEPYLDVESTSTSSDTMRLQQTNVKEEGEDVTKNSLKFIELEIEQEINKESEKLTSAEQYSDVKSFFMSIDTTQLQQNNVREENEEITKNLLEFIELEIVNEINKESEELITSQLYSDVEDTSVSSDNAPLQQNNVREENDEITKNLLDFIELEIVNETNKEGDKWEKMEITSPEDSGYLCEEITKNLLKFIELQIEPKRSKQSDELTTSKSYSDVESSSMSSDTTRLQQNNVREESEEITNNLLDLVEVEIVNETNKEGDEWEKIEVTGPGEDSGCLTDV